MRGGEASDYFRSSVAIVGDITHSITTAIAAVESKRTTTSNMASLLWLVVYALLSSSFPSRYLAQPKPDRSRSPMTRITGANEFLMLAHCGPLPERYRERGERAPF